ncbi:hypothetical protein M409DRAFT_65287 [Zasmidium cellare ATCC 36951]|uniref:Suppressor of forked domain-containing protein n=1 Tax=Zasmidium cellare ATCC 36951 TaxID=1080233 RepID=A0A6A6CRZ4_ZASCE|nr:uncharacterized protein M409DRAFT_65287 [Zasmidium cellare ATCC 36951]KAF2168948.1 hypothetical protein M409DRAFT_65287 [Zasmidium cellare ATCC 36951]
MADFDFNYSDDLELRKLHAQVLQDPEEFEHWEKLVRAAETQEGGLNRNSSPQAIAATRNTYDNFLARFPLFFGYWKKYADLEFAIGGTEAAEMVYERGVASVGTSVDMWTNYCAFKIETSHDADVIRELFDRAAESVGLDYLSHPFWDKYIEFEERLESPDHVFAVLGRVIHIPLHQYARYWEKYQILAKTRPVDQLAPAEIIAKFREDAVGEGGQKQKNPAELERDLRTRIQNYHADLFKQTQTETTNRWTYEQNVKRPYFHVTPLDEEELDNWRKYLDFEELEGDYTRTKFLYERCMVSCAKYDEFWYRYARWTMAEAGKHELDVEKRKMIRNEEVRNIYRRASCTYSLISSPAIRLQYAKFEESVGKADVAIDIHEAILMKLSGHLETIISLVNTYRRQYGADPAIGVLTGYINSQSFTSAVKGSLVAELARLQWKVKGDAVAARATFTKYEQHCLDSQAFWQSWLFFERDQPGSEQDEPARYASIKMVYETIRNKSALPSDAIKILSSYYLGYLEDRGDSKAMEGWTDIDKDINGPVSIAMKANAKGQITQLENGHAIASA